MALDTGTHMGKVVIQMVNDVPGEDAAAPSLNFQWPHIPFEDLGHARAEPETVPRVAPVAAVPVFFCR